MIRIHLRDGSVKEILGGVLVEYEPAKPALWKVRGDSYKPLGEWDASMLAGWEFAPDVAAEE